MALVALQTLVLPNLQKERTVAECKAAVHTFPASDAKIVIDDIFKIGRLYFSSEKSVERTELVFRSFVSGEGLRIEKAGAEVAVAAHGKIVKTFNGRNQFVALISADSAPDAFLRINLPNERIPCNFVFCGEKSNGTEQAACNAVSAKGFQQRAPR